ncbi:MAG TPA: ATP-grasp domain-containing protein [Candidatus Hypogeohydataceae bacterium YC41]
MILILTHRLGFESDYVIDLLRSKGAKFFRFNAELDVNGTGIDISFSANEPSIIFYCDGRSVLLKEISVAWFQQPPRDTELISNYNQIQRLQHKSFLSAYYWACNQFSGTWLNKPSSVFVASNKIRQLEVAKKIGLNIPQTIVTNNPSKVAEFFGQCNGQVIVKNLDTPWYVDKEERTWAAYTKALTSTHLQAPEKIKPAPLIYQQYIPRKVDIRAVVVGTDIFAGMSIVNGLNRYDSRRISFDKVLYTPVSLPDGIRDQLLKLMTYFDLQYASADFCVASDGRYYFLDLNCTGTFIWLEKLANLPISTAIANFLMITQKLV